MNKKCVIFSLALMFVFAFASANAESSDKSSDNSLFESVKKLIEEKYNPSAGNLSGYAKSFLKNERIELNIDNQKIGLITKNAEVVEIKDGGIEKPTVRITMKRSTFDKINSSDNPFSALKSALKKGDIKVKGVGVLKWMKFSLTNLATITGRVLGL